jgi:MFS family permease
VATMELGAEKSVFRAFSALRQRNFRLYWIGQLVSVMGTWMQTVGQAWLVLQLTHSPFQLGVVGALQLLPVLLLSLVAGVLVDHWPKRRVLLLTQAGALLQALALWYLVVSGAIQLWQIYVLAFLLGLTACMEKPARQAIIVELTGRDDLPNAVALNSALANLARIVGPSVGGVLIAVSGVALLFLLNAASYLAVILALALMRTHEMYAWGAAPPDGRQRSTWRSLREGLAYLWRTPAIFLPMVVVGFGLLFGSNFNVVLPLFATSVLHVGAPGFGFLSAALGAGSLLGALWLAWTHLRPTIRRVLSGGLIFGSLLAALAVTRFFPLALVLIAGIGFAETIFVEVYAILAQLIVPDRLRGRVTSVSVLFIDGTVPPGYLLTGWLSSVYGAPRALLLGALLTLLVVGAGWLWRTPAERGLVEAARLEAV